ncbi:MAG: hypothetical protein KAI99_13825 [Cyclobacteriaceae bacterium]|nr:hypothetical protein [Cyclobacteriaceae bacterium]
MKANFFVLYLLVSFYSNGQDYRPGLFFREDFKETPAEIPVSQKHIANEDVILSLYGSGQDSLKKSHHDKPIDDPYYLWSGLSLDSWAVTFKHRKTYADLSSFAKIKWRTKQAGFHNLRIILKLADGRWLVSDQYDGPSNDWRISEFNISDINWWLLDIETIKEIKPITGDQIDLSKVEEIGCTDLMKGGKSNACSRLDWIEVYAKPVQ